MDTKDLEELLQGGRETPQIEFKEPLKWDVDFFAKHILAMTNIKGGGWIIIGMAEKGSRYERKGVSEEQETSYDYDIMRDQFAKFPSHSMDFWVECVPDKNGTPFVVIRVLEFDQIPVICIKPSEPADTEAPVVYYRNTDKKVESAPISNYRDFRNLLERSAVKVRERWNELGLKGPYQDFQRKLDEELGKLR